MSHVSSRTSEREIDTAPREPADWPRVFAERLNAGDLEAVVALYEPEARFVTRSGETIVGAGRVRPLLAEMIEAGTRLRSRVRRAVTVDDVALLYTDFEGTANDASGRPLEVHYDAIEILRRQPDGTWKLIVGDPNGRGRP
jgi:ketosteroid isomerase-like protein